MEGRSYQIHLRITVVTIGVLNRVSNDIICQEVVENWKMFSAQQGEQILVMSEGNDNDDDDDDDGEERTRIIYIYPSSIQLR